MEYDWTDGGCLLLADALATLFEGRRDFEPVALVAGGRYVGEHYLIRYGRWHLDADGACLELTLLRRYETATKWSPRVVPFKVAELSPGVPRDQKVSERIASYLVATLV